MPKFLLSFLLFLLLALPASGHGTFEANELETHVLNDEGTDTMQEYGGYDINEVFLRVAHDPALGEGAAGDGFYFRLEAYGELRAGHSPTASGPWRLAFHFTSPTGAQNRSIATTDGATFAGDFDALVVRAEGVELHVDRAFLLFSSVGVSAGDGLSGFRVESLVGDDLRDVAPGPLCVPMTACEATYDDPLAIPGRGLLVANLTLSGPEVYLGQPRVTGTRFDYTIEVPSALGNGAQHILLRPNGESGWNVSVSPAVSVEANGTATFRLTAQPQGQSGTLMLEVITDVGGRLPMTVEPNGTVLVAGVIALAPPPPEPEGTPAAGLLLALGALGLAACRRRTR